MKSRYAAFLSMITALLLAASGLARQQPAGPEPTRLALAATRDVSVFLGQLHEKEERVADYRIHQDEKVVVDGLQRFGLEPFEIGVVRVAPFGDGASPIVNKTSSVEVVTLQPRNTTLPSYALTLRNRSSKDIVALEVDVVVGEWVRSFSRPQGKEGRPLMEAGGTTQVNVEAVNQAVMTRQGYAPDSLPGQSILIGAAVFGDGTYEGDAAVAAETVASRYGQKLQLGRVVDLVRGASSTENLDRGALVRLGSAVAALEIGADTLEVNRVLERFPELSNASNQVDNRIVFQQAVERIRISIQVAQHHIKKDLLDAMTEFQKLHKDVSNDSAWSVELRTWLSPTLERYQQWLTRL